MIKFEYVDIKNFKSFGNKPQRVSLENLGTHLITGTNNDTGEQGESANGAGKTTVFSAILFCLFGKDLDKRKADEMINLRNAKNLRVEVGFSLNNNQYRVVRGRKPNVLELYENEQTLTRDSIKNTDEEIQKLIGISYDIFVSVFFMNPFKETFMSMSSAAQRNYMEDVLCLDMLADRAEKIKSIRKDINVDIKLAEKDYDHALKQREREEDQYNNLLTKRDDYNDDIKKKIKENQELLEASKEIDFTDALNKAKALAYPTEQKNALEAVRASVKGYEDQLGLLEQTIKNQEENKKKAKDWQKQHDDRINDLSHEIAQLPSIEMLRERDEKIDKINAHKETMNEHDSNIREYEKAIRDFESKAQKLFDEYDSLDSGVCPYCRQVHKDNERMESINQEIETIKNDLEKEESAIASINEQKEALQKDIDRLKEEADVAPMFAVSDVESYHKALAEEQEKENPYETNSDESLTDKITEIKAAKEQKEKELSQTSKTFNENLHEYEEGIDELTNLIGTAEPTEIQEMKQAVDSIHDEISRLNNLTNPYDTQLQEFGDYTDHEAVKEKLDALVTKGKHADYLAKLLTDPKSFIRKNIVDQYVPYLNKKITEYTQYLDLPHTAEIKSDMTVDVEYMAKNVSYFILSRGERLRLDMATTLAFRDLLKIMGRETNIMMIDEVLDSSLDGFGRKKTFSLIKENIDNVMLISHREEFQEMVDSTMTITKENGFSVIDIN